jgi:hypothetical protein
MCWGGGKRWLCNYNKEQEEARFKEIMGRYIKANGEGITLERAIYIYSPPVENNTARHAACISKNSGIPLSARLVTIK